jgi:hypothetical protein
LRPRNEHFAKRIDGIDENPLLIENRHRDFEKKRGGIEALSVGNGSRRGKIA